MSSGKSTVCRLFADLGAYVISADDIVHDLLLLDKSTIEKVIETFGEAIFSEKKISRKALAEIVFNDSEKLRALEAILYPKVVMQIIQSYENIKNNSHYKAFVCEIPLIGKAGLTSFFDIIIAVTANPEICKERFKQRGFASSQYEKRQALQPTQEELSKLANIILPNNGSIQELIEPVERIIYESK